MALGTNTEQRQQSTPDDTGAGVPRLTLLAFVTDTASGAILRETLANQALAGLEVQQGGITAAIAAMLKRPSPKVLLVDVSGEEHPLVKLSELSNVLEPSVRVLVVGDRQDVNFYRQVTRSLGATEYLYKPLSPDMVARFFGPVLSDEQAEITVGGRILTITGTRGGVGATTVAVNIAWYLAENVRRYTLLLDPNLQTGNAAMMLGLKPGVGLRTVLEMPERLDAMFVERAVQSAGGRLNLFSGESDLADTPTTAPDAAAHLIDLLRQRYNFVVVDVPLAPVPVYRDLFNLADQRMLVLEPTLVSVREALRLLALPHGPRQKRRATLVLNCLNQPGGLTRAQVEEALELKVDFVLPNLPKQAGAAATLGRPLIQSSREFLAAIKTLVEEMVSVRAAVPAGAAARSSFWTLLRRGK
jgi:pilus assembly protein CpaE